MNTNRLHLAMLAVLVLNIVARVFFRERTTS